MEDPKVGEKKKDNENNEDENDSSVYGDFEEVVDEGQQQEGQPLGYTRIKIPRGNEKAGKVVQRLGGNRMDILCQDGKTRNCRVPGRFKRRFWLRPGDYVIIIPWEYDDSKGDIVYQYKKGSEKQLRKAGLLENIKDAF